MIYIPVKIKFSLALICACLWVALSVWLAQPWLASLAALVGMTLAIIIISLIAFIPGFMYMFMLVAFLTDQPRKYPKLTTFPGVSLLIAAYNEEANIQDTLNSVLKQDYLGEIEIIVIDDGSSDQTLQKIAELKNSKIKVLTPPHAGKAKALNTGLAEAKHDYIVSIDADTFLAPSAIYEIVSQIVQDPAHTAAVAGSIYVKNSRENFMTRLQEWDYFHAIAAIKRVQSLLQGTLVAQGAFSIYRKKALESVGGWTDSVGEDIILTWALLKKKYRVGFAQNAVSFTNVPNTYRQFFYQRSRWAKGMLEAFAHHPGILTTPRLSTFVIYWNLLFPLLDLTFLIIFIPGVIAAFFGYYYIAGPMTLAVLPLSLLSNLVFYSEQKKLFAKHNYRIRRNYLLGFTYIFLYQFFINPAVIHGYFSFYFNKTKNWGTK